MFRKAFSILELEERKDRRVVKQDFHGNCQVNVICFFFFAFFSGCAHSGMVRKLFTLQKLTDKVGRRDVDPHGRLRAALGRMG